MVIISIKPQILEPVKQICCSHLHVAGALWVEAAILSFHVCETCEVVGVDVGHVNLEEHVASLV